MRKLDVYIPDPQRLQREGSLYRLGKTCPKNRFTGDGQDLPHGELRTFSR